MKPAIWKNRLTGHWMVGKYGKVDTTQGGTHWHVQGFHHWVDALERGNELAHAREIALWGSR